MHAWHRYIAAHTRPLLSAIAVLSLAVAPACGDSRHGQGPDVDVDDTTPKTPAPGDYGGHCNDGGTCEDGTSCVQYTPDVDDFYCTTPCSTDDDCPQDPASSCLSLDTEEGLRQVCVPDELCIDPDRDGYGSGPACLGRDCDQGNPRIHPGAPELCDGIDNNCNGLVDENTVDANLPCDSGFFGACADGWSVCEAGTITCPPTIFPGTAREICNGIDDDCDGLTDEGPDIDENNNFVVGVGRACGVDGHACYGGTQYCDPTTFRLTCDDPPEVLDTPDLCDGVDNNCDGRIDEDANDPDGLLGQACTAGIGTCRGVGTWVCDPNDAAGTPVCTATAHPGNAETETCNYNDDDCDGVIDNGFVNSDGVYHTKQHCGRCDNDCDAQWGGNPTAAGVITTCGVQGQSAECSFTCLPDHYDLDNVPHNGCEFSPDATAIYVAMPSRGGADSGTCGDFEAPCATINRGIQRADETSGKSRVRVAEGLFEESLTMRNGISVMGGHSARNWLLDPTLNTTTLRGAMPLDGPNVATVVASNINQPTELSGLTIEAGDAQPSGSSYGVYARNSNASLRIANNTIIGGRGGVGTPGAAGDSGASGGPGANGANRVNDQASCSGSPVIAGGSAGSNSCGITDVSGGAGAHVEVCPISSSAPAIGPNEGTAEAGPGTGGGAGGESQHHHQASSVSSGNHLCAANAGISTPRSGGNGSAGNSGQGGAGANSNTGTISGAHWSGAAGRGSDGGGGSHGAGGGGGGSSGGLHDNDYDGGSPALEHDLYHYGPTGGGGGAGGCGGNGGQGGHAGGSSFGIFVSFSSANTSSVPVITGNTMNRGQGGQGGRGGQGGAGGTGGAGGEGGIMSAVGRWSRCGAHAARGGSGGGGGHGGGGGGGAGGVSFDIAVHNATSGANADYANNNTFELPPSTVTAGAGGAGGDSVVNNGSAGPQGASGTVRSY